ncbi:MAG TPA: winged helix-turn-helix domain-containing protein [Polyangiaceae bacterium]|nr:winged helix-turn-helix domain-containing protein [Polyangiaceae bacterium]
MALEHAGEATIQLRFGEKGVWGWLRDLIQGSNRDLFQGDNRDLVQGSNSPELRSVEPGDPRGTSVPSWHLDEAQRALVIVGERQPLSALEYRALSYLLEQAGRVVTREQLLAAAWEQSYSGSNVVDALIRLLRKKLGPFAGDLETVRGHGYRLSRSGRRADVT